MEFWAYLKRRDPQMCTFGEPKRAHLRVQTFKNTTKISREDPQREKKRGNGCGRGKESEILGGPAEGGRSSGGGPAEAKKKITKTWEKSKTKKKQIKISEKEGGGWVLGEGGRV